VDLVLLKLSSESLYVVGHTPTNNIHAHLSKEVYKTYLNLNKTNLDVFGKI